MSKMMSAKTISIIAAIVLNEAGHMLLVRKTGTRFFMQPGGKAEPGESPLETLAREIFEELGCQIAPETATRLGRFAVPAANELGWQLDALLYQVEIHGAPSPSAEIAELLWLDPSLEPSVPLAPLTHTHALALI